MRILLVGEFSGFHNNLKKGLKELGHEVVLAASGDGFKKLPYDINIGSNLKGIPGKVQRIIRAFQFVFYAKSFDVVQFINPDVFPRGLNINKLAVRAVIKRNKKCFLAACGDDYAFVCLGSKQMRYSPIPDSILYDLKLDKHPLDTVAAKAWLAEVVDKVDGVIPVMHEYELGYSNCKKLQRCIPLPLDVSEVKSFEMPPTDVITVFHGDNRYGFKGTRYVEEAFTILKQRYPSQLELVIAGNMPLADYLRQMQKAHIVVDQVNSYSCGMNALYAMAMGKIVLGGAEPEGLTSLGLTSTPVINVTPSGDSIVDAIEALLADRNKLVSLGRASRAFVEEHHCSVKVAQRYMSVWNS